MAPLRGDSRYTLKGNVEIMEHDCSPESVDSSSTGSAGQLGVVAGLEELVGLAVEFGQVLDDDGPGLSAEQRAEATRRGQRLDESKPGSGLGLSIVTDLVGLYEGDFRLDRSPDGGLRAAIELPAV